MKIKYIEINGDYQHYNTFTVGQNGINKIEENRKPVEWLEGSVLKEILIYSVYKDNVLLCEIEYGNKISIRLKEGEDG